jgi:hypothetical protein
MPKIVEMFPKTSVIARKVPGFDAFDDSEVLSAVKQTGKSVCWHRSKRGAHQCRSNATGQVLE